MDLQDREAFTFGLAYIICRRYVMMLASCLVVVSLFVFAGYLVTPTWEAEVLLLAEWRPLAVSPLGDNPVPPKADDAAANLAQMLGGKGLAYDMVRAFRLDERARLKAREPPTFRDWAKVTMGRIAMSPITFLQWLGLLPTVNGESQVRGHQLSNFNIFALVLVRRSHAKSQSSKHFSISLERQ